MIVLCLVSVLLLTMYLREGDAGIVHSLRGAAMTLTTPVRLVGSAVSAPFSALGNAVSNATASSETLEQLREENERLISEVAELTEKQHSAERLEGLANLQTEYKLKSTTARIIGSTGDAWSKNVTIDKGAKDGVEVGMPVCGSGGIIGQVSEVSAATSTVRLVGDERSGISAMVQSSRAQGILQGQPDGTLRLNYVVTDAEVKAGDIVISSGLGGSFPKGLPLGVVASVERSTNDLYYSIVVRGSSSAESNEEVLVVTDISEEQVASDEEVEAANTRPQGGDPKDEDGQTGEDAADSVPVEDDAYVE